MKTRTRNRVAAALLMFGVSLPAHASPICLAPEPACALVLLGAVVTTIVHEADDQEVRHNRTDPRQAPIKASMDGINHRQWRITPSRSPRRSITARSPARAAANPAVIPLQPEPGRRAGSTPTTRSGDQRTGNDTTKTPKIPISRCETMTPIRVGCRS